jgi:hypothetical protein
MESSLQSDRKIGEDGNCFSVASVKRVIDGELSLSPQASFGGILTRGNCESSSTVILQNLCNLYGDDDGEALVNFTAVPDFYALVRTEFSTHLPSGVKTFSRCDPCHYLHVPTWTSRTLNKGNRKRLRRTLDSDSEYCQVDSTHLSSIYELLEENRRLNSLEMPVTLDVLQRQVEKFPAEYALHTLMIDSEIAAAAVTVDVWPKVNYVFMWGHRPAWGSFSPTVALCANIVEWNRSRGIEFMDLGTSGTEATENLSLSRFKENLGGIRSVRRRTTILLRR